MVDGDIMDVNMNVLYDSMKQVAKKESLNKADGQPVGQLIQQVKKIINDYVVTDLKGNKKSTFMFTNKHLAKTFNTDNVPVFFVKLSTSFIDVSFADKHLDTFKFVFALNQLVVNKKTIVTDNDTFNTCLDTVINSMNLYVNKKAELFKL